MPRLASKFAIDTFLRQLGRTGNFALSAELAGLAKSGLYKRRARDPTFADACTKAMAGANAGQGDRTGTHSNGNAGGPALSTPGQLCFSRYGGRPQLRRLPAGRLTSRGVDEFLLTLARTANVRFAARHVGIAASSIYRRRRSDPQFSRDMDAALDVAAVELECALQQAAERGLTPRTEWLDRLGEDGPRMTVQEALWYLRGRERKRGG